MSLKYFEHTFPITGVPCPRPRARAIFSKKVGKWIGSIYMPTAYEKWKLALADDMAEEWGKQKRGTGVVGLVDMPIWVEIVFGMPLPKSRHRKRKPRPWSWHEKKPDVDNLAKSVLDAGSQAIWKDDTSVQHLGATKYTVSQDEEPFIHLLVLDVTHPPDHWVMIGGGHVPE